LLSQLGPVFKTIFRQAESADARLEIRREEKENSGKKKERGDEAEDAAALWEDSMSVSVLALHGFLAEFLKSHGAPLPQEELALSAEADVQEQRVRGPVSSVAARAVKAYTAMAPVPPAAPQAPVTETPAEINPADLLSAEEIRTIHNLIADVDALAKAGVQTLTITMTGTFLDSLVEAVRLTKTTPAS
jgi:hypothetical protein